MTDNLKQTVTKVWGHDGFLDEVTRSVRSGRMQHAWLLTGPVGIGKASAARLVAAWLLAETTQAAKLPDRNQLELKVDSNDPGSTLVLNGVHPDYLTITANSGDNKSGQIKMEQIRALNPFLKHKPGRGGWRVAMIDSMDEVNRNGANAMLKLLEEPPQQTVIFLISSRLGGLPSTIRSRCRLVRMTALSAENFFAVVDRILPDANSDMLDTLLNLSQGSPGQAIKLAQNGTVDLYQCVCKLLQASSLDVAALSEICSKWGHGGLAGRDVRAGAVVCIERLLRYAALEASGMSPDMPPCSFEKPVIFNLVSIHGAAELSHFHLEFIEEAKKAEELYLDFGRVLERHLTKIFRNTLP